MERIVVDVAVVAPGSPGWWPPCAHRSTAPA